MKGDRRDMRMRLAVSGLLVAGVAGGIVAWWLRAREPSGPRTGAQHISADVPAVDETQLRELCSHCHKFADPNVLPRSSWADTVWKMSRMPGYGTNVRRKLDTEAVVRWFEERAPERLTLRAVDTSRGPGKLRMKKHEIRLANATSVPFVSHIRLVDLAGDARPELLVCDMRGGSILMGRLDQPDWTLQPVGRVANPAHVEAVDLDADGRLDLIVANLGSFTAIDHTLGSVEWFRGAADGSFQKRTLAEGLGRVADVQPADIDGDGDLDLVVAEFGYRATGHLLLLENRTEQPHEPVFVSSPIDGFEGASHVPLADLNGDGLPDIVALYSQAHELVRCYLNRGGLRFELRDLYQAPHPAWGFSGSQLVDLDGDGDLDVLLTNGDTFDDSLLKPCHGIQWLENLGKIQFEPHDLVRMYGVYRAEAADMDGDGDGDVVACALAEPDDRDEQYAHLKLESILWLEQIAPGQFVHRSFEAADTHHPTLTLGDYDLDGDVDLFVGNGQFDDTLTPIDSSCVDVWENLGQ